jgi:hypothetical protein
MRRSAADPAVLALGAILLAGLLLRLVNIDHGLPFVYHPDEALHFTNRAVGMFGGDPNPHYFQNPSAYTYILHVVLRFAHGWPFTSASTIVDRYHADPTGFYVEARVVATLLCLLGAVAVYAVGRRLWGAAEGVAAAAIMTFAFLPVAYSRLALTDVGVFLPVALATYLTVRVLEAGGRRRLVLAGASIGLAVGFKYTAGLLVVPLLVAVWLRHRDHPEDRELVRDTLLALAALAAVFLVTTPFFLLDLDSSLYQLKEQARSAGIEKLGQARDGSVVFYLRTLTWGLGWGAALAALGGFAVEAGRDRRRAILIGLFPALLFTYIAIGAERYFARWLMPAYPVLALFAAVALVRVTQLVSRRPVVRAAVLGGLLAAILIQPLLADVRTSRLLGREDTRAQARDFALARLPAGTRTVVEPAVPDGFFGRHLALGFGPPPKTARNRAGSPTRFIRSLSPARLERYRQAGFCTVIESSLVRDRALGGGRPRVAAYYRALDRQSHVIFRASPYKPGAAAVPFDFDWSTHLYYPRAYERPGPLVTIRRLDRCTDPTLS